MSSPSLLCHSSLPLSNDCMVPSSANVGGIGTGGASPGNHHLLSHFAAQAFEISRQISVQSELNMLVRPELFTSLLKAHIAEHFGNAGLPPSALLTHEVTEDAGIYFSLKPTPDASDVAGPDRNFYYMVSVFYNDLTGLTEKHQGVQIDDVVPVDEPLSPNMVFKGMIEELGTSNLGQPDFRLGCFQSHPQDDRLILISGVKGETVLYGGIEHFRVETGSFYIEEQAKEEELSDGETEYLSIQQLEGFNPISKVEEALHPTHLNGMGKLVQDDEISFADSNGVRASLPNQLNVQQGGDLHMNEAESQPQVVPQHN